MPSDESLETAREWLALPAHGTPLTESVPLEIAIARAVAIDTEGTPDDPICLTWATEDRCGIVDAADVPEFWRTLNALVIWHNAPWDWQVMVAMGVPAPWETRFVDTMEQAYLRQTSPQGLKALAWRHFRVRMQSWEDTVMPYWEEQVLLEASARICADTTVQTHSPKTGRRLKKPKQVFGESAKALKRALRNPKLLATRMGFREPTLRDVPDSVLVNYAVQNAHMTYQLWKRVGGEK